MLKIKPLDYKFCPFCGMRLQVKTEDGKKRKYCSSCRWTHYPHVGSAAGAIIVKKGKALMVKRARDPYKNTWMFPAGFVDFGEHPLETLVREIREETGLEIKKAELIDVLQERNDPRSPGHFIFFYCVETSGKKLKNDKAENMDIEWKDIKKTPKIGWESHRYMFKLLKKKIISPSLR